MNIRNTIYALITLPFLAQPVGAVDVDVQVRDPSNKRAVQSVIEKLDRQGIDFPYKVNIREELGHGGGADYSPDMHQIVLGESTTSVMVAHEFGHAVEEALQLTKLLSADFKEFYDYGNNLLKYATNGQQRSDLQRYFAIFRSINYDPDEAENLNKRLLAYSNLRQCFTSEYGHKRAFSSGFGFSPDEDFAETFALHLTGKVSIPDNLIETKETPIKLKTLDELLRKLKEKTRKMRH